MKFRFPVVIIDEDFRSENVSGSGVRALAEAIEHEGMETLGITSFGDTAMIAQQQNRASCFILSIDDDEFSDESHKKEAIDKLRMFVGEIRRRNEDIPIFLYGETRTSRHIPNDVLKELHGFIHMFEDTPEFVARHIIREAKVYLDSLAPPFFRALTGYAADGSYSWHCPGHSGGVAFLKSPVGQMFHQFFGENMLRADVCNAVEELGQLLDHDGAIGASERNAARIFNADHCFFVTNGTSTSNKMVWHHTVAPGDVVVVDRNCHKSILHKSPVGQMFHQFFGENMLRADVCNAVDELGQLLDHTGAVAASEQNAARIFGADHLFFVTNGTSTSNKIVWHANVADNDIVVVDRNCHKSVLHAIIMTGAVPVFLMPKRNHYGIIGPIPKSEFLPETIAAKIAAHPIAKDLKGKPQMLTLTQSTYDGILYNVDTIKEILGTSIENLHFDEAWLPHATFHEFYEGMHAIGRDTRLSEGPMVYACQSTHKLLAGLSQASQILVQESPTRRLDRSQFNEAYLMHVSTSPQYAIIASCDVAAAMMEPPGGTSLVEESILEAMDFRRAMRKVDAEFGASWWFKVWGPEELAEEGMGERDDWILRAKETWHGFGKLADRRFRDHRHPRGHRHPLPVGTWRYC